MHSTPDAALPAGSSSVPRSRRVPTVEISTSWFAALRRRPHWRLVVTSPEGRHVASQVHASYREALDAAVSVCRSLNFRPEDIDLAA